MRSITDRDGVSWQVWRVIPTVRMEGEGVPGSFLSEEAADGWLCFESDSLERRRFYQVPDHWESLSDPELEVLCYHATKPRHRFAGPQSGAGSPASS